MYENLKMREVLDKLDSETVAKLRERWPEVNYVHYTARELFHRMDVKTLSELYAKGLEINCACLTVLTAEALIQFDFDYRYDWYQSGAENTSIIRNIIVKKLQKAFDEHKVMPGSNLVNVLGFTLMDKCYQHDKLLAKYGQELSRGLFEGPEDWFEDYSKHSSRRAISLAHDIPWAKALLEA